VVPGIEEFECRTPLVVPPLIQSAGHLPLKAIYLGFQSGVPVLPLPPQPALQAYPILNASWYRKPWVVTRATLGSSSSQSLQEGAGEILNSRVDYHTVLQFRV